MLASACERPRGVNASQLRNSIGEWQGWETPHSERSVQLAQERRGYLGIDAERRVMIHWQTAEVDARNMC